MAERPDGLTDKQALFVLEYLKDKSGKYAAIRAGYSPNSAKQIACELLKEGHPVADAVEVALAEQAVRTQADADYVIRNLRQIVERTMQRAPVMVKDGKDWVQATDDEGNHIWQFDAKGANQALTLIGKHLGMYLDRKEITVPQGTGVLAVPVPVDSAQWASAAKAQQDALTRKPEESGS